MKDKMEKANRERKQRVTELIAAYQKGDYLQDDSGPT